MSSGMTHERDRVAAALDLASKGACVALISSGDAGIYGMAGLALELATAKGMTVPIDIIPGITAASAAAARFGAPLMLDFATISLSDLLVPWDTIRKRIEAVAAADLVVVFYNPRSHRRRTQIEEARDILLRHRPTSVPVGIATAIGHPDETIELATLGDFLSRDFAMRSLLIVGNTTSRIHEGWFITPRGYLACEPTSDG